MCYKSKLYYSMGHIKAVDAQVWEQEREEETRKDAAQQKQGGERE